LRAPAFFRPHAIRKRPRPRAYSATMDTVFANKIRATYETEHFPLPENV
jgi:hypothetical protein